MRFLQPHLLHLLWLGLIPLALYLFRRKARKVQVSTLLFFRSLAREHQESAWLRRMKRLLSLLLTLLVVFLGVFALSRPYREGGGDMPKSLVVLLDRSASMAAMDASGKTSLELARGQLREQLRTLPENVVTSLIVYDGAAEVVQSRSTNRRELIRLLDATTVVPVEDEPEQAFAVAKRLAALDAPAEIWHISDREMAIKEGEEKPAYYRFMNAALPEAFNVGITAFQIRPAPLARNRFEAFVEVRAGGANGKPLEATLEARIDGRPVQLRQIELKPGESTRLVLPLEGGKGQRLEMEVRADGDVLPLDNIVMAPLPDLKPLVVAWFSETPDPFTELALTSLLAEDRIQVLKGGAKDWPMKEKPDVYVFENWLPDAWPTERPVLVLNPPGSLGPIMARKLERAVPYDAVRPLQPEHPLLFRVSSARVAVTQTAVLNVGDTLETLWMAGNEPVLAAGDVGGQRVMVSAFNPSGSEQLALLSAYPLLMGNAIYWCAEGSESLAALRPHHTGETVPVSAEQVRWDYWDGQQVRNTTEAVNAGWLNLQRIGIFEWGEGRAQSSVLVSSRETDVPAKAAAGTPVNPAEKEAPQWATGGSWWSLLLWAAVGILLVESWLFHRKAVY